MKIRFLPICASSALLLAGCAVEESPMEGGSIAAVMEDIQTRTAVTDEGTFTWSSGDQVWLEITANPGYVTGTLSSGAGTGSANFSYGTYFGDMTGKAVYPFNSGHDVNGDELSVVLPASYDLGTNLSNTNAAMYGVETGGNIKFNHLAGVMRFKFRNAPAGTDRFILTLDKKINGTFTADLTEDHPVLRTESASSVSEKSITLNFDPLTSAQDIMLYVPLPLGTYTTLGLEVKAASQSVWSYSNTVTNTINRKSLILMPTVTLEGSISGDIEGSETPEEPQEGDYVDEYGINHGQGVEIDGVVWAPVNCGYHATDYKYGKLYQWGRKYGQGYDGDLWDVDGNYIGEYSDASVPSIVSGPVSLAIGQLESNSNNFYTSSSDWLTPQNDALWNSGTEDNPVKTEYDPCPEGWRLPTEAELNNLSSNKSTWTTYEGQVGYWFSGSEPYSIAVSRVFFPASARCQYNNGIAYHRGEFGNYWSSRPISSGAYNLYFFSNNAYGQNSVRSNGYSVRCVKDLASVIEPTDPDEFSLIDLGLSVKWANYNIGASSVDDVGVSSDWGHEEGRDADCPTDMNISGSNYDLVKAELGGNWRLPTAFDFMELEQKCVWTPTTIDGVSGNIVTGPNGNSIFLPDVVYWTGTAREYSTDDYDYVYGIDKQPQSAAIASGKYNRPVQGPIRVFPDMTCTVKEVGKNSADIEVSVEDYSSYGIDLGLQLYVSLDGAFYTDEKTENEGVFSFEITELSSNTTYYARASIDVLGYKMLQDLRDRVDFQTLAITDGDGCVAEPMDLGLSVKWASWNLGASCISDRGLKLDWGCISVNDNTPSDIYNMNISGTEYDPATVIWGPEWRLPTMEEWRELGSNYLDRSVNAMGGVLLKETLFLPRSEMGVTSYLSGEYGYGSYFLLYGYYYTGSISNNGYVRPVYDPMPQLGETIVSSVAPGSASLESSVIRIGGGDVTSKGFIYSTEESFDSNTSVTMTVNGDFEADIIGLSAETTYYVRAFATNSYGTSYGETITITTPSSPDPSQPSYTLQLSSSSYGWQKITTVANPDSSLYDGVYASTNGGVNSSCSLMYIDISGYDNFSLYVRSYAESNFDFVVVSNLDCTLTQSTVSGTNVKMTTKGNQNSGTSINAYTLVEFTGIGGGDHRITVMYRKDGSVDNNDDKGYVLIPKNQ